MTYVHTDALGSVVAESDADGNVIRRYSYEPYGSVVGQEAPAGPGYTGHVADEATGLLYMQQRYMDPKLGVFLSVDPVQATDHPVEQFNRYRYANGNPYKFTDPDGRLACSGLPGCGQMSPWTRGNPVWDEGAGVIPKADVRPAQAGQEQSGWKSFMGRLGLQAPLTKNGNILDFQALAHDVYYPLMDSPGGSGAKLATVGVVGVRSLSRVQGLAGLGNIGSHGVVDANIAVNSASKWLGSGY